MKVKLIFFFSVVSATVKVTTTAYRDHGSKNRAGSVSQHSKEIGRFPLHSYMKQIYYTRARGNRNGSFTVSVRDQKILATSIRGFQPEKNGTRRKYSTVDMQFRFGQILQDDIVVEAELILTSKRSRVSRKFHVSVFADQPVSAPNDNMWIDSRALPRRANVELGLNVTPALRTWSLLSEKIYTFKLKVENSLNINDTASMLNFWRCFQHGYEHGPFLVLYTQSKNPQSKDDIWKLVTVNPHAFYPNPLNTTEARNSSDITQNRKHPGKGDGRSPRNPTLICYQVSFAIKMRDFYSNVILPNIGFLNYCDGNCHFPIQNHLTPTIHAVIWALWWKRNSANSYPPKKPLCVPTKLDSLTVVLSDPETGQLIQKEWLEFSAKECGCR